MSNGVHLDSDRFLRYHKDIFLPEDLEWVVRDGFLPPVGTVLKRGLHYEEIAKIRGLPTRDILMPAHAEIVEITLVRETRAVFRTMFRFRWTTGQRQGSRQQDLVLVIEGDYELVTGFWRHAKDHSYGLNERVDFEEYVTAEQGAELREEEVGQ